MTDGVVDPYIDRACRVTVCGQSVYCRQTLISLLEKFSYRSLRIQAVLIVPSAVSSPLSTSDFRQSMLSELPYFAQLFHVRVDTQTCKTTSGPPFISNTMLFYRHLDIGRVVERPPGGSSQESSRGWRFHQSVRFPKTLPNPGRVTSALYPNGGQTPKTSLIDGSEE